MTSPDDKQWLCVGEIGGAHGIKGWVRVHAFTDSPEGFLELKNCRIGSSGGENNTSPIEIVEGRMQGKGVIVRLAGVDDRTAAEGMRHQKFWISSAQIPPLGAQDYYWRELIGLRVYTDFEGETRLLGEVAHLLETGANDVLVLRHCEGSIDERERLIPYLYGDVVESVQQEQGRIVVRWHPDD